MRSKKDRKFQRAPGHKKPIQKRIRVTKRTADLLMEKDAAYRAAVAQAEAAKQSFIDTVNPILSEHGIERGNAIQVTQKPPYELIVEVPR